MALYPLLDELGDLSVQISLGQGKAVHDSSYLALGRSFGKEFLTAHEKLMAR